MTDNGREGNVRPRTGKVQSGQAALGQSGHKPARRNQPVEAVNPPSTTSSVAVTYFASSEARNSAA